MDLIRKRAYARAGLVGNPSDGYGGKTIAAIVRNFWAEVVLYEWEDVDLILSQEDHSRFSSLRELVRDVEQHGYYGGIRLVKATIKKFVDYCDQFGHELHDRNFSVRYETRIPRNVGLAGSSAIITATLRCLMEFYRVEVPMHLQPSLALAVETGELGIAAGLQDRVVQAYEGLVYMDFAPNRMQTVDALAYGHYEPMDPSLLPPLYVAYSIDTADVAQPTYVPHNDLRTRFQAGDTQVVGAMQRLADLTDEAHDSIVAGDHERLATLINENFDIRLSISPHMLPRQREMVERARSVGASAKFAGSGGAIVGTYLGDAMFAALEAELREIGCRVIKPRITTA